MLQFQRNRAYKVNAILLIGGDHGLRAHFTPVGADRVEITVYGKKDWVISQLKLI